RDTGVVGRKQEMAKEKHRSGGAGADRGGQSEQQNEPKESGQKESLEAGGVADKAPVADAAATPSSAAAPASEPKPEVRPELLPLVERLRGGRCVLCAGSRLGADGNFRTLVEKLVSQLPDADDAKRVLQRRPLAAAGWVRRKLGDSFI